MGIGRRKNPHLGRPIRLTCKSWLTTYNVESFCTVWIKLLNLREVQGVPKRRKSTYIITHIRIKYFNWKQLLVLKLSVAHTVVGYGLMFLQGSLTKVPYNLAKKNRWVPFATGEQAVKNIKQNPSKFSLLWTKILHLSSHDFHLHLVGSHLTLSWDDLILLSAALLQLLLWLHGSSSDEAPGFQSYSWAGTKLT